jgi:serine/threonine protein kinase
LVGVDAELFWEASDILIKDQYVTKLIKKKIELEIMSQISHPNIIEYLDHFEDSNSFYLVMEKFGNPCKWYNI